MNKSECILNNKDGLFYNLNDSDSYEIIIRYIQVQDMHFMYIG